MHHTGITIDGAHSRDLDDAFSVQTRPGGGWKATVYIADTGIRCAPDAEVTRVAFEKVATRYFARGNDPMLPRGLSEDRLSLLEGRSRRVLGVEMLFDRSGQPDAPPKLFLTKFRSRRRYSYEEAAVSLDDEDIAAANMLAVTLYERRRAHGALTIYDMTAGVYTDEDGAIHKVENSQDIVAHLIIQELMIATNGAIARYCAKHAIPIPYRVHSAKEGIVNKDEIIRALDEVQRYEDLKTLWALILPHLDRARYDVDAGKHYGLGGILYAHATSPIRRLADFIINHQLRAHLRHWPLPYTRDQVAGFCVRINEALEQRREQRGLMCAMKDERIVQKKIEAGQHDQLTRKEFYNWCAGYLLTRSPVPQEIGAEFKNRLGTDKTGFKLMLQILLTQYSDPVRDEMVDAIFEMLQGAPHLAFSMINVARQTKMLNDYEEHTSRDSSTFIARVGAAGQIAEARGRRKKTARDQASVRLLRRLAGLNDTSDLAPTAGHKVYDTFRAHLTSVGGSAPRWDDLEDEHKMAWASFAESSARSEVA